MPDVARYQVIPGILQVIQYNTVSPKDKEMEKHK